MREVQLSFGCLAKPIKEQLSDQGFIYTGEEDLEELRICVNKLRFANLLSDSEWHKINQKSMKYIIKNIKEQE